MRMSARLFIAIELPKSVSAALADWQARLKAAAPANTVRWTEPQNLHLTLHFLGETETGLISSIGEMLAASAANRTDFVLSIGGMGCFPNMRRPRIVWAGVAGQLEPLLDLHRDLGQRLRAIGYRPEPRPYAPHLTLGRVKNDLSVRQLSLLAGQLAQAQAGPAVPLHVQEVSLMQSALTPSGPIYTSLARTIFREV
jgi:2'-5' RNA ligase